MKFSFKLLLCTVLVMALGLGFCGFYFVNYQFNTSLDREIVQALEESSILRFAFETAALNVPAKYDVLQDNTVEQIASNMETGGERSRRLLRLSDERRKVLYESTGFSADNSLLMQTQKNNRTYRIIEKDGRHYIQTGTTVNALDRVLFLETVRDIDQVFQDRSQGLSVYRKMAVVVLLCGTFVMYLLSSWLTRPIRLLTRATKRMTEGDYNYRAKQVSDDELGQLTLDFNRMAGSMEENVSQLEEELKSREEFVAAFAHELKTPMTSIIGYADMLRSHKLDEEKRFLSANYIYTEGKRLETMSFRLLDLIVTKRQELELQVVQVESLFLYLRDMYQTNSSMQFHFTYDKGPVQTEPNLIKSVLMNLLDNACKASEPGSLIRLDGQLLKHGYRFLVRDHGVGIPKEELDKITEAFYMVDKSRSRSRNGAGLGLALCSEILQLHGSRLEIESEPGKGTVISFVLPYDRDLAERGR